MACASKGARASLWACRSKEACISLCACASLCTHASLLSRIRAATSLCTCIGVHAALGNTALANTLGVHVHLGTWRWARAPLDAWSILSACMILDTHSAWHERGSQCCLAPSSICAGRPVRWHGSIASAQNVMIYKFH